VTRVRGRSLRLTALSTLTLTVTLNLAAGGEAPAPHRIASLNLAADELLVELVPPERLVAVTSFADDPGLSNVVGRVPRDVTRITHAQLERLVELRPDLVVVADFTDADFLHMLSSSGLPYYRLGGLDSWAGIRQGILQFANVVGAPAKGQALVAGLDLSLGNLDRHLEGASRPRVLWWNEPDTAGRGTLVDAIIERAGGRNLAVEMGVEGVRPVGAERVLAADPDVFLVASGPDRAALLAHPVLSKARAVREGRIVEMPGPLLSTLTHHAARSCWFLAHALHPERVTAKEAAP